MVGIDLAPIRFANGRRAAGGLCSESCGRVCRARHPLELGRDGNPPRDVRSRPRFSVYSLLRRASVVRLPVGGQEGGAPVFIRPDHRRASGVGGAVILVDQMGPDILWYSP